MSVAPFSRRTFVLGSLVLGSGATVGNTSPIEEPRRYGADLKRGLSDPRMFSSICLLRQDLNTLGFRVRPERKEFDDELYYAVREFQMAARNFENLAYAPTGGASRDLQDLQPILKPPGAKYEGALNGEVDKFTEAALTFWINNHLRSPIIIAAYNRLPSETLKVRSDRALWRDPGGHTFAFLRQSDDLHQSERMRSPASFYGVFVRDLSGYYPVSGERNLLEVRLPLGHFAHPKNESGGPALDGAFALPECEATLKNLTDLPYTDAPPPADPQQRYALHSTFRVIRAVAEQHSQGYLDAVDASYSGGLRFGLLQWILSDDPQDRLPGPLRDLQTQDNVQYKHFFEAFLLDQRERKPAAIRVQHGWFAVHRFAMAARSQPLRPPNRVSSVSWNNIQWKNACLVLKELLERQCQQLLQPCPAQLNGVPLGKLYTSEKAVALLLHWHLVRENTETASFPRVDRLPLQRALDFAAQWLKNRPNAGQVFPENPEMWKTPELQAALTDGLFEAMARGGKRKGDRPLDMESLLRIYGWPMWRLSTDAPNNPQEYSMEDPRDAYAMAWRILHRMEKTVDRISSRYSIVHKEKRFENLALGQPSYTWLSEQYESFKLHTPGE
jgi:hypothetical protein